MLELERMLPAWLLKKFYVAQWIDYPNKKRSWSQKVCVRSYGQETGCLRIVTQQIIEDTIFLMQMFASFRPLWGQNSVAQSHFVLLIHQICSFLPSQRTGTNKNVHEKNCVLNPPSKITLHALTWLV